MKPYLILISTLFGLLLSVYSMAQESPVATRSFKLKIMDRKGKPMSGIVVQSTNSGISSMTNSKGFFIFDNITDRDSIRVYIPGFSEATVPIEDLDSAYISVKNSKRSYFGNYREEKEMNVGYGSVKDRDRTTPTSQINVQELLTKINVSSLYDLLQGRVAGLDISRGSGGAITSTIRGTSSFLGSNEPLVVIDGMPVDNLQTANDMVNVRDIKTIDVLKDGSIYGSRGANGVILISTK